jgi:hypothetical protein
MEVGAASGGGAYAVVVGVGMEVVAGPGGGAYAVAVPGAVTEEAVLAPGLAGYSVQPVLRAILIK